MPAHSVNMDLQVEGATCGTQTHFVRMQSYLNEFQLRRNAATGCVCVCVCVCVFLTAPFHDGWSVVYDWRALCKHCTVTVVVLTLTADRLASIVDSTSGLQFGKTEVLRT